MIWPLVTAGDGGDDADNVALPVQMGEPSTVAEGKEV